MDLVMKVKRKMARYLNQTRGGKRSPLFDSIYRAYVDFNKNYNFTSATGGFCNVRIENIKFLSIACSIPMYVL